MKTTTILRLCAAGAFLAAVPFAHAVDFKPDAVSVTVGAGKHGVALGGVGVVWDWNFERLRRHAELTAHTEVMVNHWRADAVGGGHQSVTQFVVLPSLRIQLSQGRSPWFVELGIGASWMDRQYTTPRKQFSTQWNFYDMLGAGYRFGAQNEQDIGLRWVHVSNAGIKKPNPGEDFLQLRYARRF
jgi:lipid A 3-O-deacylase